MPTDKHFSGVPGTECKSARHTFMSQKDLFVDFQQSVSCTTRKFDIYIDFYVDSPTRPKRALEGRDYIQRELSPKRADTSACSRATMHSYTYPDPSTGRIEHMARPRYSTSPDRLRDGGVEECRCFGRYDMQNSTELYLACFLNFRRQPTNIAICGTRMVHEPFCQRY